LAKVPEVNMLSWREAVRGEGSLISTGDADWLQKQLQKDDSWRDALMSSDSSTYRSLAWYLGPDGTENGQRLLRDDAGDSNASRSLPFETLVSKAPKCKPAGLLAVDYVIHCLFLGCRVKEDHAEWLVESTPQRFKPVVHAYLRAHGQQPNRQGLLLLLNQWRHPQDGVQHVSETCRCVWELLSKEQTRMQVVRITDADTGERMVKLLRALIQREPSLAQSFELLGDFADLDIEAEMDQGWFEEFQRTAPCHYRGKRPLRTPHTCKHYVPPTKRFTKKLEYMNRRCSACKHVHVPVRSYADLENRPVLLILVAKGRLGDTFPKTLRCIDMRSRCRADEPTMMMSTLVQELGRLCGYPSGGEIELPYALISTTLKQDMEHMPTSAAHGSTPDARLAQLLASHGARLDVHMQLEHKQLWDQESAGCDSLLDVTRLMRRYCRARSSAAGGQTDRSEGTGRSYDADRRSENLAINDRYHCRRIGLSAEPQVQITSNVVPSHPT